MSLVLILYLSPSSRHERNIAQFKKGGNGKRNAAKSLPLKHKDPEIRRSNDLNLATSSLNQLCRTLKSIISKPHLL